MQSEHFAQIASFTQTQPPAAWQVAQSSCAQVVMPMLSGPHLFVHWDAVASAGHVALSITLSGQTELVAAGPSFLASVAGPRPDSSTAQLDAIVRTLKVMAAKKL